MLATSPFGAAAKGCHDHRLANLNPKIADLWQCITEAASGFFEVKFKVATARRTPTTCLLKHDRRLVEVVAARRALTTELYLVDAS
jgi:hypothetical protein